MTKIFAFSGNSNTGKTSAIHYLKNRYDKTHPDITVKILPESARKYINQNEGGKVKDVRDFEKFIFTKERERLDRIEKIINKKEADLVFVDRTSLDAIIYAYRRLINNSIQTIDYVDDYPDLLKKSKGLYTKVVFFTTPIKKDNRFPIYNNEHINKIFEHSVKYFYGEKVVTFTNNIFFQDNIESTIFGNLFDL